MGLQFVFGDSISRKSEYMYRTIVQQAEIHPTWQYLFVVPEQATLLAQKELIKVHPKHALGNIDVVSFARLAYRIFDEQNIPMLNILDDTGKSMILRKVAQEQKAGLAAFRKNLSRAGFIKELKSLISEFYQYGVRKEELEQLIEQTKTHPLLQLKLKDLLTVYTCFQEQLKKEYITAEELLPMLCKVVEKRRSALISNSVILLDEFTGFTPVQYQLLELLLIHARHLICSVTVGSGVDPYKKMGSHELFFMSHTIVERMREIAIRHGISCGKDSMVSEDKTAAFRAEGKCFKGKKEFFHMEQQLFRYPSSPYREEVQAISICRAQNPQQEVSFLLQEILRLVREEGYEYREIGVVVGDLQAYENTLVYQLNRSGLPFFVDRKKSLSGNPLIELVQSALEVLEKDFSYESVFYHLRNGLNHLNRHSVDELENYVLALGIRGKSRWMQEWERTYPGFTKDRLPAINETRRAIMELFEPLMRGNEKKDFNVRERTKALFFFLDGVKAQEGIESMAEEFGRSQELHLQREYEQAYGKLLDLLEQIVDLMGDEVFSLETYRDILDAGLEDIQVGLIPPTIDRLVIGDIMRTRLGRIKALFVLGVNDGLLPQAGKKGSLLSELDRELIRNYEVELAPTAREDAFTQKYYVYLMMTKPSSHLYLCYSQVDSDGKLIRPSYLIQTMKRLFPRIHEQKLQQQMEGLAGIKGPEDSFEILVEGLRRFLNGEDCDWWRELYSWYKGQPDYQKRLNNMMQGLFYCYHEEELSQEVARRLFRDTPMNSVTRLERFASCAYAHFLAYGLCLKPRLEYQLSPLDYGNIFHKAIEAFFGRIKEDGGDWTELDVEERINAVKESVQSVAEEYGNTIFKSSARNQYLIQRMERITDRTIWALAEQWRQGQFQHSESETMFSEQDELAGMKLPLQQGITMALQGRIDRIDVAEKENKVYVKVIDYKSGSTDFDVTKIYHGLQLQLIIYLEAALEMEQKRNPKKQVVPAGIYYYHIKDPLVEQEDCNDPKAIETAMRQELKMNGLSNASPEVLDMLDHSGNKKSEVIKNLERNDAGTPIRRSVVAEEGQMEKLCEFGLDKAKDLGQQMLSGDIAVNPYEYKKRNSCEFCEFQSVCGFDARVQGFGYRRLQELTPEELWKLLEES